MTHRPTTLERAFELARSGEYLAVGAVKEQLRVEGFSAEQITGPSLMRQLRELCATAVRDKEPEAVASGSSSS